MRRFGLCACRIGIVGALSMMPPVTLLAFGCAPAQAQTQLPGIVVTSPSPIARQRPPAQPEAASQDAAEPAPPQLDLELPPGSLIVTDDAFVSVTTVTDREIVAK